MDVLTVLTILGLLLLVVLVLWSLTIGRRYFIGETRGWPQIRRDLYSGSLDEGMYPLDPTRRENKAERTDPDHE